MIKEKEREKRLFEEFMRGLQGRGPMEHEVKRLITGLGLSAPRGFFIPKAGVSKEAVFSKAGRIGFPVVVKAASPAIRSKTEIGGVRLGLLTRQGIFDAARELIKIKGVEGVLVERMVEGGTEAIVGGLMDPQFGPVVMFGLGGIFTEVFRDVSFALAPANRKEALKLVARIKGQSLLLGGRGRPPVDLDALAEAIIAVSRLVATGLIKEIDLNPVSLFPRGAFVLDAKIFV